MSWDNRQIPAVYEKKSTKLKKSTSLVSIVGHMNSVYILPAEYEFIVW